jgi:6-phosphofructokinase 2
MGTIVTITFNPAIDKSTTVPQLIPEKKLNCTRPVYEPGGGGINVARAIKRLGADATAIYLAGGASGKVFTSLLEKENIPIIPIETLGVTRENVIVKEVASNQQFRFGMPGDKVNDKEWESCLLALSQVPDVSYLVVSGSLPDGIPTDIFERLAHIAHAKSTKLVVDTSGNALILAAQAGAYLIKPNLKELAHLVGRESLSIAQVEQASKEVVHKYPCEVIVTSLGAEGAMITTKEDSFHIMTPQVKIQSTVGAGDSMLAGIVLSLFQNKDLLAAAQYGVACGTAATMNEGTELCHLKDVEMLYAKIVSHINQKYDLDHD